MMIKIVINVMMMIVIKNKPKIFKLILHKIIKDII
jgi:hypothetical protein